MNAVLVFRNRRQAGLVLARHLTGYCGGPDVLVLALPRGGVPVAFEVARSLRAPLDVFAVRKLAVPGYREVAMGAIAAGGAVHIDRETVALMGISEAVIAAVVRSEEQELARTARRYRARATPVDAKARTVILVDDGMATGASMRAAVAALRELEPQRIVVAVPVASRIARDELSGEVDELVCAETPESFHSVGLYYDDFTQTTDDDVLALLESAAWPTAQTAPAATG